ncbi:uncharacterized protein TRIADDRAFT_34271, partial [Trichoplax adhaerens]
VDSQHHTMAKYFMELCLPEYDMVSLLPSEIASASLLLAVKICNQFEWNATLQHYSGYTEEKLYPIARKIVNIVSKSATSKYQVNTTKNFFLHFIAYITA